MSELKTPMYYKGYPEYFEAMRKVAEEYGSMPQVNAMSAYTRAYMDTFGRNPYIQNSRVKQIPTLPVSYSKAKIVSMLQDPLNNEEPLREVSHYLEWGAYPYFKIRKTYQDINEDFWYIHPNLVDSEDVKTKAFERDYKLAYRLTQAFDPSTAAHKIRGEAVTEGKTFYTIRYRLNRSHGNVDYASFVRLPSDYCRIVGYNDLSKYTVAFDMTYFFEPGAYPEQFGDLFTPYIRDFENAVGEDIHQMDRKSRIDIRRVNETVARAYEANSRWMYWVILPAEKVWTFEIDDTSAVVAPVLTGLFISMASLAKFEDIQMELISAPLVAVLTGEIPYFADKNQVEYDAYKLSPAGRAMYEQFWVDLMNATNTTGVGFFTAPVENIKMHQLNEIPSAVNVSTEGYSYAMLKSGLGSIIPISDNPRAGVANLSVKLESKFCQPIYDQMERLFDYVYRAIGLRYEFKFKMFGDIYSTDDIELTIQKNLSMGLLPELFRWYAIKRISPFEDMAMSEYVKNSGLTELRIPLVSSYNARQRTSYSYDYDNTPGRPTVDIEDVESEGQEDDLDNA